MKWIFFMVFLFSNNRMFSQPLPAFKSLRYEEEYEWMSNDTSRNFFHTIKYIQLSLAKENYLSIGGETRAQYFYIHNEGWGDVLNGGDGYALTRHLIHADFHSGRHFRAFVQLQSSLAASRINPGPVEDNPLEIHQAFADLVTKPGKKISVTLRLGRQEFLYGSQRLVSVREGPNNRQSFDAVKSIIASGNSKIELFYAHYVLAKRKAFNDHFNRNIKLWGMYVVKSKMPLFENADFYYLGLYKRAAAFDDGNGRELRHSIGTRFWSNSRSWKYDVEMLYQFGKLNSKTISAWTASVNASYTFSKAKLKPEVGIKTELISGDHLAGDQRLQTFNPLFPRGAYFGLAALIGPANLVDIHPSLAVQVKDKWQAGVDYDIFWRYSTRDGVYGVNGALIYTGKAIPGKFIGGQAAMNITYEPGSFINFTAELTWFHTGKYLVAAGTGKNIIFTGLTAQLKF